MKPDSSVDLPHLLAIVCIFLANPCKAQTIYTNPQCQQPKRTRDQDCFELWHIRFISPFFSGEIETTMCVSRNLRDKAPFIAPYASGYAPRQPKHQNWFPLFPTIPSIKKTCWTPKVSSPAWKNLDSLDAPKDPQYTDSKSIGEFLRFGENSSLTVFSCFFTLPNVPSFSIFCWNNGVNLRPQSFARSLALKNYKGTPFFWQIRSAGSHDFSGAFAVSLRERFFFVAAFHIINQHSHREKTHVHDV